MIGKKYDDCPSFLQEFLFYMLTIRGHSEKTVHAYYIDLRTFFRYIKISKSQGELASEFTDMPIDDLTLDTMREVTLSDVYSFLTYVMSDRANNSRTRARKVSSIRGLFKYLTTKSGKLSENPVKDLELPTSKKSLPKYLTLEESMQLVSHVTTSHPQRDYCILILFLNCGMRLSELVGINVQDIRENTIRLLGKGNKERIIYLNEACLFALQEYLNIRQTPTASTEKNALFLSSRGKRISARRVQQIVDECLQLAGLSSKEYSPHKLRHTAATLMYQHGDVDIRVLKEILGHSNLATTELYTHVSDRQIENAANRSPLSKIKNGK